MIRILILSLALVLPVASTWAQEVEVKKGRLPVSVQAFTGENGAGANIVATDLNRSMLMSAKVGGSERYSVTGTISGGALSGRLLDGGNVLFARNYTGDERRMLHQFSDDVLMALTKVKGFSTSRIACISASSGKKELYVADIDGFNGQQLTNDKTISARPEWSNDGTKIAYVSYKSGYPDVYVIELGQNQRRRVAFFPGINTGPSFSPDGGRLALTLSMEGNPQIYTIPASGGAPTRLTRDRGTETSPSWSPDGSKIVYDSDARGSVQLYTISSSGGTPTRLSTGSGYSAEPDWSPDGSKIAFTGRAGGQFQIGVYDLNTGRGTLLTTGGGQNPSWTRNSRHLIYAHGGDLYVLDTVTRQTERLDINLTRCSEPAISR